MIARAAVALLLAAVGCRTSESRVTDGPYADRVNEYIPKIEKALGLTFKTPPRLELRTRDQVREFLMGQVRDSAFAAQLAGEERAYKVLGLIPDTMDLAGFFVPLLTEQVIGYYDPKTKVLYVVQGAPDTYVGITIMHELVHALQDQYFNLDSLQGELGDSDRQFAAKAIIEGQATFQQAVLMAGGPGNIAAALPGGFDQLRAEIRELQATQPIFATAPMVIQESLLFPYINGLEFVRRYQNLRKSQIPFDSLPVSTEQIMHEDAFFGAQPDAPTTVTLPPIAGSVHQNTMGEFGTRLFLFKYLPLDNAVAAAQGWDGDRYAVVRTASGDGFVWALAWDSAVDAAEFVTAAADAATRRYGVNVATTANGGRRVAGPGRTVSITAREIDGRTVVLYVDVPAGTSETLVDLARVTLR